MCSVAYPTCVTSKTCSPALCLIGVAVDAHPDYPLILIANRDEFRQRPTAAMHWWDNGILAGADRQAGGTWLGVSRRGRFAAVTNFREVPAQQSDHSRGNIPTDFLLDQRPAEECARQLGASGDRYAGFNALLGQRSQLWWVSNRGGVERLTPGVHALSNHLLNTPWPKVANLTQQLDHAIAANRIAPDQLFKVLHNDATANDDQLPDTGIGLDGERALSPMFINTENYGTRSSSVIRISRDDRAEVLEMSYDDRGQEFDRREFAFSLE